MEKRNDSSPFNKKILNLTESFYYYYRKRKERDINKKKKYYL